MTQEHARKKNKPSPENRRETAEANLARGAAHRFKPGQSGNPGGRPRTAKLSEACRAKLASPVPGDAKGRTYAEAITDMLAQRALKGDIRAVEELANRAEGRPGPSNPDAEAFTGIKYIIVDVPRPQRGAYIPNTGPGQFPTTQSNVGKS
jgi:Family of unknown function (DUF5681)